MPSWYCLPVLAYPGPYVTSGTLQILYEGTTGMLPTPADANVKQGNCKFGAKCALAHYLPNGHRVSKADLEPIHTRHSSQYGINGRDDPSQFPSQEPTLNEPFSGQTSAAYFPDIPLFDEDYDTNPDRLTGTWHPNGPYLAM